MPSLVITFETTTAAMAFEADAQAEGVEGRLIPVPRDIHSGCGLAFMVRKEKEEGLRSFLAETTLVYGELYELEL